MFLHALPVTVQKERVTERNPRLAGQLYPYTFKELVNWSRERDHPVRRHISIMQPVTQNLTKSQSAAVAAYLSYLK